MLDRCSDDLASYWLVSTWHGVALSPCLVGAVDCINMCMGTGIQASKISCHAEEISRTCGISKSMQLELKQLRSHRSNGLE